MLEQEMISLKEEGGIIPSLQHENIALKKRSGEMKSEIRALRNQLTVFQNFHEQSTNQMIAKLDMVLSKVDYVRDDVTVADESSQDL